MRRDHDFKTTWEPLAKYLSWEGGISRTSGSLKKSEVKKYILKKHAKLYEKYPRAKARVFRNIGTDLVLAGKKKEALVYFSRSFRTSPGLMNLTLLLISLTGRRIYSQLLAVKKRFVLSIKK